MRYKDLAPIILQSIDECFCTFDGIKKFVEEKAQGDIAETDLRHALDMMRQENKITLLDNDAFSAYFPAQKIPSCFFRGGKGKVNAHYDGVNNSLPVRTINLSYKIKVDDEEDILITPYFTPEELNKITNLIAGNCSYKKIASVLKIPEGLLTTRARTDDKTRAAIFRGQRAFELERDSRKIFDLAATGSSDEEIAKAFEIKLPAFAQKLADYPELEIELKLGRRKHSLIKDGKLTSEHRENSRARRKKLPTRFCQCGNPLGARVKECRGCYLEIKDGLNPLPLTFVDKKKIDRRIRKLLSKVKIDNEALLKIAMETILESSRIGARKRFANRLLGLALARIENPS